MHMNSQLKNINSYKTTIPFVDTKTADTLIIACSDPRYRLHLNQFEDQIGRTIDQIIIPGGPLAFCARDYDLTDTEQGVTEWTDLLAHHHHVEQILLVSHQACAAYANALAHAHKDQSEVTACQQGDLTKVYNRLKDKMPDIKIRLFMEKPNDDGTVTFEEYAT